MRLSKQTKDEHSFKGKPKYKSITSDFTVDHLKSFFYGFPTLPYRNIKMGEACPVHRVCNS